MNQHTDNWRNRQIAQLEESARRDDGHANALEADALDIRRRAETARKTAEFMRKGLDTAARQPFAAGQQAQAAVTAGQGEKS